MKTALQREVQAAGWRSLGVGIGFLLLLAGAYFWGQRIEGRIDTVVIQRQHDHRQLHKLAVHEAREVQGSSKSVPSLEVGATDAPSQANAPSVAHQLQAPVKHTPPRHHSPPAPSSGGSEPSPAPASSPSTAAPTVTQPTQTLEPPPPPVIETPTVPPILPTPAAPALIPEAIESVREAAEDVGETVGQVQCGVRGALVGPCPP